MWPSKPSAIPAGVATAIRAELTSIAAATVEEIIVEVPSYAEEFTGHMGQVIGNAVELALAGFLELATARSGADPSTPIRPALEGAYELGRGEARSGRSMDALLAAYRVGARVSWRHMSASAVRAGLTVEQLAHGSPSWCSPTSTSSRPPASPGTATSWPPPAGSASATWSGWRRNCWPARPSRTSTRSPSGPAGSRRAPSPPSSCPRRRCTARSSRWTRAPCAPPRTCPGTTNWSSCSCRTPTRRSRPALLRSLDGRDAVVGPARPWTAAAESYARACRALQLGLAPDGSAPLDTDVRLADLVLRADDGALADLRARALAPLADLSPGAREKLTETLRSWLLHHGRREKIAEALFVHPQTVRYRMTQLRELYGKRPGRPAHRAGADHRAGSRPG